MGKTLYSSELTLSYFTLTNSYHGHSLWWTSFGGSSNTSHSCYKIQSIVAAAKCHLASSRMVQRAGQSVSLIFLQQNNGWGLHLLLIKLARYLFSFTPISIPWNWRSPLYILCTNQQNWNGKVHEDQRREWELIHNGTVSGVDCAAYTLKNRHRVNLYYQSPDINIHLFASFVD